MIGKLDMKKVIKLTLPSSLGCEKVAIASAATVGKRMGLSQDRIEDLKTAIGEACINAIEHGNKGKRDAQIVVVFKEGREKLEVCVKDHGPGVDIKSIEIPSIDKKIKPGSKQRGWGVFLIKNLTDEVEFCSSKTGGEVKMIIRIKRDDE